MIVASSSGRISTSGGAAYGSGSGRSAYHSTPSAGSAPRAPRSSSRKTMTRAPESRAHSATRGNRSPSTRSTRGPQSSRAYVNSSPVHQAFSGTATRPANCAAQKAICHSG